MDDPWGVLTPRGTDRGTDGLQGAAVAVRMVAMLTVAMRTVAVLTHGSRAHCSHAHMLPYQGRFPKKPSMSTQSLNQPLKSTYLFYLTSFLKITNNSQIPSEP